MSYVWVIPEKGGNPRKQQIETGGLHDDTIDVVHGLQAGEWVATAGLQTLRKSLRVRPMSAGKEGFGRMNIAGYVLRHRTVTMVAMLFIAVAGMLSYQQLGRLEDPEFTIKEAVVFTYYPGATAEEVEQEVSEPLETEIQQLKQLKEVRSISRAGVSIIFAEVEETYDKDTLPQVWDELRRKVAAVAPKLPPGCYAPSVNDDFGDVYGILYAITGDGYSLRELGEVAEDLRRELLQCEDVGRIDFWGMPDEALFLEMDRAQLVHLGIPMSAIFHAVRQQNAVTDAGRMVVGGYDVPFRVERGLYFD